MAEVPASKQRSGRALQLISFILAFICIVLASHGKNGLVVPLISVSLGDMLITNPRESCATCLGHVGRLSKIQ